MRAENLHFRICFRLITNFQSTPFLIRLQNRPGLAGIGRTHLSAIERGQRKPTLETFYKLAYALDRKPSSIMEEIEKEMERKQ